MTDKLPAPLVPAEVDLRGFEFMPLYGDRLFKSATWIGASPEGKVAALRLWWQAYGHEFPAASLPDNDTLLAEYAGYGVALKAWLKIKPQVMRGWVKCSDGRLYHPFVADLVKEAWERRKAQRDRTEKARKARLLQNQSQNQLQTEKSPVTESVTTHVTASTGQDRTGQGQDSTSKSSSASNEHPTAKLAAALRSAGIRGALTSSPYVQRWASEGVSVSQVVEAARIAVNDRGKENPPLAYLAPIVAELCVAGRSSAQPSKTAQAIAVLESMKGQP